MTAPGAKRAAPGRDNRSWRGLDSDYRAMKDAVFGAAQQVVDAASKQVSHVNQVLDLVDWCRAILPVTDDVNADAELVT